MTIIEGSVDRRLGCPSCHTHTPVRLGIICTTGQSLAPLPKYILPMHVTTNIRLGLL